MDEDPRSKLQELAKQPYDKQAKQFLNAYWASELGGDEAQREQIFRFYTRFWKLDKRGKEGCELDEFEAHQFLEKEVGAMTVKDMREALQKVEIHMSRSMSMIEFLIYHYKITDWDKLVNWVAAGSAAQQKMLADVQASMKTAQDALSEATAKADLAKAEADKAAEASRASQEAAEASSAAAQEQSAARQALEAEEAAQLKAIRDEEDKANDESLSTVKRNRAKAQLAILKSTDSQPLRRARITTTASERKQVKAAKAANAAAQEAKAAQDVADQAHKEAADAAAAADAQVAELAQKLEEAKAACAGSGSEEGTFWWLDREFEDQLKFMGPKQRAKAEAAKKRCST